MFDNILNDAQTSKAYTKLFTKIKQHVKAKKQRRKCLIVYLLTNDGISSICLTKFKTKNK